MAQTRSNSGQMHRTAGRVLIVLPAYNEAENLGELLERIDDSMQDASLSYHVIIVDDGSSDATADIARQYAGNMPIQIHTHERNQGLGATIRDGLRIAAEACRERDIVVTMDSDNTHTPGLVLTMTRLIKEGNDVVIASRYQPGSFVRGVSLYRRMLSSLASILFMTVFPTRNVRDYTSGYRAYRGPILKAAFERYGDEFVSADGFACMVDILLRLRQMDVVFREYPLILRYDFKKGESKMNVGSTIRRTLGLMMRRRFGG